MIYGCLKIVYEIPTLISPENWLKMRFKKVGKPLTVLHQMLDINVQICFGNLFIPLTMVTNVCAVAFFQEVFHPRIFESELGSMLLK